MGKVSIFQELMPSIRRGSWTPASLRRHLFGEGNESIAELCQMMMDSDGEYSSLLLAERILNAFEQLDRDEQIAFFEMLNDLYDLDIDHLRQAIEDYDSTPSATALKTLTSTSEPKRQELFRRLNLAPGGTRLLVKMRERALALTGERPALKKMDPDFRHLFKSWFNRGFLLMEPIDWTTPAHILEKIIAYEAVHEIQSWAELRRRLEPEDRHCFGFFHPAMEDEPLVFVEVALTDKVPERIDQILETDRTPMDTDHAICAVFYSISNCHGGLAGVSFGNFLIKQVADSLHRRFPQLKQFATLSPAPGFRRWLEAAALEDDATANLVAQISEDPMVLETQPFADAFLKLAARYYLLEKNSRKEPLDPVARFHLKNGARLERLNILGDTSDKGLKNSFGLMVNYVYDLSKVAENHENYMQEHQVVCSSQIRKLLPQ